MVERRRRFLVAAGVTFAVLASALALGAPADAATSTSTSPVIHRIYVSVDSITPSTTDDTVTVPTDRASAAAFIASINAYWNRETGGAVSITLGGFETRTLSSVACSVSSLFSAARTADFGGMFATTAAWAGTNDHLLALSREPCSSSSVGQGSVGGAGGIMATSVGSAGDYGLAVAAHEFGHNLGFLHANVETCPTGTDSGASCAMTPYADFLDVMGGAVAGSAPHVSTPQLISLGYLHDYVSLSLSSGSVRQQLRPVGAGSGTRSVQITDPSTGDRYWVEYRIPDAADAASPEFGPNLSCTTTATQLTRCWGAMSTSLGGIRVLQLDADGTTVLSVGTYGSTHLNVGQSFENQDGAFKVTVNSLSPTDGAQLTFDFGSSITPAPGADASSPPTTSATAVAPVVATPPTAAAPEAAPAPGLSVPIVVKSATHVSARLRHATIRKGTRPVVIAVVTGASRPTGKLTVWANGHKLRTVTLRSADKGLRAITLPPRTSPGKLAIRVTYSGTKGLSSAASSAKRLRVR